MKALLKVFAKKNVSLYLMLIIAQVCIAQSRQTYSIQGRVLNQYGESLPFASVVIDSLNKGASANMDGNYTLKNVPPGTHRISIQMIGFQKQEKTITVKDESLTGIDFTLKEKVQSLREVTISVESEKQKLENSAKAVDVIETKEIKLQSADMGEVIAQNQGVNVRRSGGLGSGTRFSLNGLTDDQVRFFLDGIPLSFAGYSFGIANVPINLIKRVEIYKGVVPIRYGSDALGGAVNLVTPAFYSGISGAASYQVGSFGTHRVSTDLNYLNDSNGFFVRGGGFYDFSKNNFEIDVQVPDAQGRLSEATVPRFHDEYRAAGLNLQTGLVGKSWAKELSVKLFATDFAKDIQHNNVMTIPYGEAVFDRQSYGAMARYQLPENKTLEADAIFGYTYEQRNFTDTSRYVYNWFGERIRERGVAGEISSASDQVLWDNNLYSQLNLSKRFRKKHELTFSTAPTYVTRTGKEKLLTDPNRRDPLAAERDLLTWVSGLEYVFQSSNNKLENRLFFKDYFQNVRTEEALPGDRFRRLDRNAHFQGVGNSLRYKVDEQFSIKASYEWSTRLPRAEEVFGDGMLTLENLELQPERSHNANLELSFQNNTKSNATWEISTNGFLRDATQLIVLLGDQNTFRYQNVFDASSKGIEASGEWNAANKRWGISANLTWQDFRNTSEEGAFRGFKGDRIPNRPYFFANSALYYNFPDLLKNNDVLRLFYNSRYIHSFFRTWESAGLVQFKQTIPAQWVNNAGFTYKLPAGNLRSSLTAEVQNLGNAKVFDFFGVQRPGRAFYVKLTTQF